jgi:hypothetical protein
VIVQRTMLGWLTRILLVLRSQKIHSAQGRT